MSLSAEQLTEFGKRSGLFAIDVYRTLAQDQPTKNIVFSPFSIQTCVAMARMGAEGKTAEEIDTGLRLISSDTTAIADSFHSALANYVDSDILKIANKIYFMQGYTIRKEFNEILTNKFFSTSEVINFAQSAEAAQTINGWVESKTNNLIKDLISKDALGSDTRLVLLNAIHFKGQWKYEFNKSKTRDEDFYLNESDTVKVPMMNLKASFRYGRLANLDATALELPYKESDLSMLIILPNSRTGLKDLEQKLATVPLSDITKDMYSTEVVVKLPRFKAEFQLELNDALTKLGMSRMFSGSAEFGKMLEEPESLSVSKVIHKAFIDVNEEGTEAAAATAMIMCCMTAIVEPQQPIEFTADHPFFFVLQNPTMVIMNGRNVGRNPHFRCAIIMCCRGAPPKDVEFNADHPFYFMIRNDSFVLLNGINVGINPPKPVIAIIMCCRGAPPKDVEFNADHPFFFMIRNDSFVLLNGINVGINPPKPVIGCGKRLLKPAIEISD